MKNNGMTTILNWALLAGAVALLVSGIKYYNKTKTVRTNQVLISQMNTLKATDQAIRSLVADSLEYAKANPSISPVLETIVGKQAAKPAATSSSTKK